MVTYVCFVVMFLRWFSLADPGLDEASLRRLLAISNAAVVLAQHLILGPDAGSVIVFLQASSRLAESIRGDSWTRQPICAFIARAEDLFESPSVPAACTALEGVCPPAAISLLRSMAALCGPTVGPNDVLELVDLLGAESDSAAQVVARLHSTVRRNWLLVAFQPTSQCDNRSLRSYWATPRQLPGFRGFSKKLTVRFAHPN
jgi:hypothetical protein